MTPSYFAPAFEVRINELGLETEISKNITQVSVVTESGTLDELGLTIANPYPTMRWTHTSDADIFSEGNGIEVRMGYVDDLHPMFDGEITSISPTFPESGMSTVSIQARTRLHRLQGTPKTRTFQNVTDKQIVERIAREMRLTPQVDDTETVHSYVMQHNQTDLQFLTERAGRIGFELLVDGRKLVFKRDEPGDREVYTLEWGRSLKSFNPTLETLRQVQQVTVRGYDPSSKREIVGRAGIGAVATRMGGQVAEAAFGVRTEDIRVETPVASQAEADQLAHALFNSRALEFITGTGSSIGISQLRAGQAVDLLGLGPRFSGRYQIARSTHSIGDNGYHTTFSVRRNTA